MTLDDLIAKIDHLGRDELLSDWQWFVPQRKYPILLTALGNLFLVDGESGGVDFLDVGTPKLIEVAGSLQEFQAEMANPEFIVCYFNLELVTELLKSQTLEPGKIFGFKRLPALGGSWEPDNFEPTDIVTHFSLWGQVHPQIAGIEPGTPFKAIIVDR